MLRRSQVKKVYQQRRLSCGALSHESSSKTNQAFHKPKTLLAGWLKEEEAYGEEFQGLQDLGGLQQQPAKSWGPQS